METPTNYTRRLKNYWKSKDLTFIATFKRINSNQGFFNYLFNPINKNRIRYPYIDGVDIEDNRVSFLYENTNGLKDGGYYKIKLTYTNTPIGRKNPFSLGINNITPLSQDEIKDYIKMISVATSKIIHIGKYKRIRDDLAFFTDVMREENGEILLESGQRKDVFVTPQLNFIEGNFYSFILKKNGNKLPSAVPNTIKDYKYNPYKKLIEELSQLTKNPKYDKIIANMMREVGDGMYSSKQRMVFELLQNADDSAANNNLKFHIDTEGSYLTIMHDGIPFNQDDVEAITSAGESTKKNDAKKTGYKGIGFKSVFTNCEEVLIKSGGYNFSFQRFHPSFKDFDKYYLESGSNELLKNKRLLDKYRKSFNPSEDIPWQIIPIWSENLPSNLEDTNFDTKKNNVKFAMNYGKSNIPLYLEAISNLSNFPQFMLFLRNTSGFLSHATSTTIYKTLLEDSSIRIVKNEKNLSEELFYEKVILDRIEVSNEVFENKNINLRIAKEKDDLGNDKYYFKTSDGNRIDNVPNKLASLSETEITFAIPIIDGVVKAEPRYLHGQLFSSLFTYLPMVEHRLQLPFLINGDFVPSSDREKIQGDNPWNIFLISNIANQHVLVVKHFAELFQKNQTKYKHYLSLLLKELHPVTDTSFNKVTEEYNKVYSEMIVQSNFVISDEGNPVFISDILIDTSGFTEIFSNELFYEITKTKKRLPHSNLEAKYLLDYSYLNVDQCNLKDFVSSLSDEHFLKLGEEIKLLKESRKEGLIVWLDKLAKISTEKFKKIPFIEHGKSYYSLESLANELDAWIINNNTKDYEQLLSILGYHTINLNLEEYVNIDNYLHTINNYINDKSLAYERIANNSSLSELDISYKLNLIDFLRCSEFMKGIGETKYFGDLKLFVDENGIARPLRQLISRKENIEVKSIQNFRICTNEYSILTEDIVKELIPKNKLFTSFILNKTLFNEWSQQFNSRSINNYVDSLKAIYGWKNEDEEILQSKWAEIPWLYIDDELRFSNSDNIFWSSAFTSLSNDDYQTIKDILHPTKIKTLPYKECGDIIQAFKLKTEDSSDITWMKITNLETLSANTLLDWIESDGINNSFFENYTLKANAKGKWDIVQVIDTKIFDASNTELKDYINSIEGLKALFSELDEALCSNNRNKIGLLQGEDLFKAIIDSKAFDQRLAVYLPPIASFEQISHFINNLPEYKLETGTEYNNSSPEHIIMNHLLRAIEDVNAIPEGTQKIIENLRSKIQINQKPLSNYNISDRVTFGTKPNFKILKLSDILAEFQGDSDELESIKESFLSINKEKLRKLIFKTRQLKPEEIQVKIEAESSTYYSVHQVVFKLFYKKYVGHKHWAKINFDEYWKSQNREDYIHTGYKKILDTLIEKEHHDLSGFTFQGLNLNNCVDKNWSIKAELLPQWITEWIEINQDERNTFLSHLGYNSSDSSIVNLRKSAVSEPFNYNNVAKYYEDAKNNSQLLWNTIIWLSKYSSEIITKNINIIKQINNVVTLKSEGLTSVVIPIIKSLDIDGSRSYELVNVDTTTSLYYLDENIEFAKDIIDALRRDNSTITFIDGSIGIKKNHFTVHKISLVTSVDSNKLNENSDLWNEPYYSKWELKKQLPIYIYDGKEIPYVRTFNETIINEFTNDLKVKDGDGYYISKVLQSDILNNLPSEFPNSYLQKLKDWHYRTLTDESLLDEDSFEYNETFDRMLQDRFGLSAEQQKEESGNAKTHALYFLKELGFNLENGSTIGAAFYNITNELGDQVSCIVRSAKGGLLYIDKEHWEMLEDKNTYLVVIYPGNEPRLFRDRLELLSEELSENVLFRIPNQKETDEIDKVFDALESESHLILVTSKKMKESLFSKLKKKDNSKQEKDAAIKGDNFSFN
ncbi:MAG: ATP-binding protein [Prolixibacteraceae bacterium]|nr:ATP-binding protein [Prolixibacteraceae bacterium]